VPVACEERYSRDSRARLLTPGEVIGGHARYWQYDDASRAGLIRIAHFVTGTLAKPHPDLGRAGAVCPYVLLSLANHRLLLSTSPLETDDLDQIMEEMITIGSMFTHMIGSEIINKELRISIIHIFLKVSFNNRFESIKVVQKTLEQRFVDRGLVIGEFYPGCEAYGLHSPTFRPFDAPVAALAVREMTLAHAPCLVSRESFRRAYLDQFGDAGRRQIAGLTQ